ncbi:MAG TPA: nucleotide sugar dehydrogenase [Acidimicrobiales bacterium]|nr:nucleotide sugar dehydrogenase [Acidimicrobiales bacterium]
MDGSASRKVVVVGQGYVGLPLAMRAVEVGHDVVGYDVDESRVKRLASGESYVEDVPGDVVASALGSGRYVPTSDAGALAGFDVAVITVPTPLREGNPDLSYIEASAVTLGGHLRPGATVVLESTTYPGTTEELLGPLLEQTSGLAAGGDFLLGYSPERIDPGNPSWGLRNTPKVVSGIDARSLEAVEAFYGSLVERTVPVSSPKEAELAKLLENTFRHVNIALVNEIAMFAGDLGIDVWETIDAAATKPFGFLRFTPGPGVGGHCLPIDPSYLSWRVRRRLGHSFRFVELANDVNDHMPDYVVKRLMVALNRRRLPLNGSRVLVLGLAYKKNSSDDRESPATVLTERLLGLGAIVHAADPHVVEGHVDARVVRVDVTAAEVAAADAVVVLTDHDAFDYDAVAAARYVLDTRHRLPAAPNVEHL